MDVELEVETNFVWKSDVELALRSGCMDNLIVGRRSLNADDLYS
jgi:hypothetical protein